MDLVAEIAGVVVLFGALTAYWAVSVRGLARHERAVLRARRRAVRAHYAAIEAAEDDPIFSPEVVELYVAEVLAFANALWRGEDRSHLSDRSDAGLIRAWARARQRWLGDGLEVVGGPSVDLLSVINREGVQEDRVVARVRSKIHCQHPKGGAFGEHHVHLDERWTLGATTRVGPWYRSAAIPWLDRSSRHRSSRSPRQMLGASKRTP